MTNQQKPKSNQYYSNFLICLLFLTACLPSNQTNSKHLITVEEAKTIISSNQNYRLFEISKPKQYNTGHIEGAYNLWRADYSNNEHVNYSGMRATKLQLEKLLSSYAIDQETILLLYDNKGNCDAARFAWQLELWGFDNFKLINGGKKSWELAGCSLTKSVPEKPVYQQFNFSIAEEQQALLANYPAVFAALEDTNTILVDTRELYEYKGEAFEKDGQTYEYKKGAFTYGAIPSAIHFNWSNTVDLKNDHQLKPIETLQYDLEKAGITADKNIILYCQSGSRSSHTQFVLKHILNYPNVKNYDGSWIEWSYFNATKTKDAPIEISRQ